ncbi:MAG: hypothetical protein Q4F76_10565, partial [Lachnospiraceae bacterium]|nr:hypothetical protein [Lachnospiraceae bacterium]
AVGCQMLLCNQKAVGCRSLLCSREAACFWSFLYSRQAGNLNNAWFGNWKAGRPDIRPDLAFDDCLDGKFYSAFDGLLDQPFGSLLDLSFGALMSALSHLLLDEQAV